MIGLFLWAALSIGCVIGIPIGFVFGFARGQADGIPIGRTEAARWRQFLQESAPEYQQLIPHGNPGHVCSLKHCSR